MKLSDSDLAGGDSLFRGLLESAPDAMVIVDKAGTIVLINSQLREEPELSAVPLIAVTASAMTGDRDKVIAAGFDGYISKPITPETFVAEVESYVQRKQGHGDNPRR